MKKQNRLYVSELKEKFYKTQIRLENAVVSRRFSKMSQTQKQELFQRLQRYARKLGVAIKPVLITAMVTAGLLLSSGSQAQTFVEKTGANNPLNGKTVANISMPAFVDIDNDGDKDLYAGQYYANMVKFINTGSASTPAFGSGSQFSYYAIFRAAPAFVDIDNDGDQDLFVGNDGGSIEFYPNTGTAGAPAFPYYPVDVTPLSGYTNPLAGVTVGSYAAPFFVDIDNDGDKDLFIGNGAGAISFYKNTGTANAPVFALQSGAGNPFNGIIAGSGGATPAFGDLDKDGDLDAVVGSYDGTFYYFMNTGSATSPVFTPITGTSNPFNGLAVSGSASSPALVDIDNDGDLDMFSGNYAGGFQFFQNTSPALPVLLLSFAARQYSNKQVMLTWSTATEQNSKEFAVQRSKDGLTWQKIGVVAAAGNSSNTMNYSFVDQSPASGVNYYRLMQHDLDGKIVSSAIRSVKLGAIQKGFIIISNPVINGSLQVQVNDNLTLGIYNGNGQLLIKKQFTPGINSFNTANYPKGIYFLKGSGHTEKFLVQ